MIAAPRTLSYRLSTTGMCSRKGRPSVRHHFATPLLSCPFLLPGEDQGEGDRVWSSGWASLTPALSQWDRERKASHGTSCRHAACRWQCHNVPRAKVFDLGPNAPIIVAGAGAGVLPVCRVHALRRLQDDGLRGERKGRSVWRICGISTVSSGLGRRPIPVIRGGPLGRWVSKRSGTP